MKFNTTYTPTSDILTTVKDVASINETIFSFFNKTFSPIKMTAPLFLDEQSNLIINQPQLTRAITFDEIDEYRVNKLLISNSNWIRSMMTRLEIQNYKGIVIESQTIHRDVKQSTSQPLTNNEITLQVMLPKDEDYIKYTKDLVQEMYELFHSMIEKYKGTYFDKNIYPESARIFSSQNLEIEMANISSHQKEMNKVLDEEAFILSSSGTKMYSKKIHKNVHAAVYDLRNHYEILFKDGVNSDVVNVCSVATLSNGQTLIDQIQQYKVGSLLENAFYNDLAKETHKIVEVKVNVSKLAMIVLRKGHIGEVQAGVLTKETETIADRNKIEII